MASSLEINDQTRHLSGSLNDQVERACILRKTPSGFHAIGDADTGLSVARGAAGALQSARQVLTGLPQDMQSGFRDAITDPFRSLAGVMIDAGQLTGAQGILAQMSDFETDRYWQDDPGLAGQPPFSCSDITCICRSVGPKRCA